MDEIGDNRILYACLLKTRSLIFLRGRDALGFLQPLISNDLAKMQEGKPIWAANLTPQGKFAYDLLIAQFGEVVIIECALAGRENLLARLKEFKLNAEVELALGREFKVWSIFAESAGATDILQTGGRSRAYDYGLLFTDPRIASLGYRFWGRDSDFSQFCAGESRLSLLGDDNGYHALRIGLEVAENSCVGRDDLLFGKTVLLEAGFDNFGGISWEKGCYVGQELTARTKYRGLVKRRLLAVRSDVDFACDEVCLSDGAIVGDIRSRAWSGDGRALGMACVRLRHVAEPLYCQGQLLSLSLAETA